MTNSQASPNTIRLNPDSIYFFKKSTWIKQLFYWFCRLFFKVYCPITIKGTENIPSSPFIICSNHCSHMDSVILMTSLKQHFSHFVMVAAKDYFFAKNKTKIFSYFLNLIPINRKSNSKSLEEDLLTCRKAIVDNNRHLIIYPEGTRSINGKIGSFKRGPAMIAIELGIPILPVYIDGSYQSMPKGRFFPKPTRIKVRIGKPLFQANNVLKNNKRNLKLYSLLTEQLKNSITHLKEQ